MFLKFSLFLNTILILIIVYSFSAKIAERPPFNSIDNSKLSNQEQRIEKLKEELEHQKEFSQNLSVSLKEFRYRYESLQDYLSEQLPTNTSLSSNLEECLDNINLDPVSLYEEGISCIGFECTPQYNTFPDDNDTYEKFYRSLPKLELMCLDGSDTKYSCDSLLTFAGIYKNNSTIGSTVMIEEDFASYDIYNSCIGIQFR